ncbi:MAG: Mur ligase family protein [Sarcina sp.]
MEIIFLRFMDGRNIWSNKKVIDFLIRNLDEAEARCFYNLFDEINERLCIGGRGIHFEFAKNEARMIFTYEFKFISKQILEDLAKRINSDAIFNDVSKMLEEAFERDIEVECIQRNIPFYYYNENEVQVGYGANSFIIDRENKSLNIEKESYIPIISVTGSNGKTTTVKLIYNILSSLGYRVGMSSTGGVYINDVLLLEGDTTGYFSAKEVLKNKDIDVAVLEVARGGIVKQGLAYKNASVAIITSLSNDHVGMEGANSIEELARVKSLVLKEISKDGIIVCRAEAIIIDMVSDYDSLIVFDDRKTEYMKSLINLGVEAYYVDDNFIVRECGSKKKKIVDVRDIEFTFCGISKSNVRNVICAIIAVRRIHSNLYEIIEKIKALKCDSEVNLGRQNLIERSGVKFIIDYGHNEESFLEIFDLVNKLKSGGQVISVISAPGDRLNEHIIKLGKIAGENSDFIVVKEINNTRGREVGEVANLILYGINKAKFNLDNVMTIISEIEAFDYAFSIAKPEDIVIFFVQDKKSTEYAINKIKADV